MSIFLNDFSNGRCPLTTRDSSPVRGPGVSVSLPEQATIGSYRRSVPHTVHSVLPPQRRGEDGIVGGVR